MYLKVSGIFKMTRKHVKRLWGLYKGSPMYFLKSNNSINSNYERTFIHQ